MSIRKQGTLNLLKQRSDLTFKHNTNKSRHGWIRLTPAYSLKIVNEILESQDKKQRVFDPFSGTSTTVLCAVMKGHAGYGIDINPFLVWLGGVKLASYNQSVLSECVESAEQIVGLIRTGKVEAIEPPNLFNIKRWWNQEHLGFLCQVKAGIEELYPANCANCLAKDLLYIAFCRTLINLSNASFNHQSMSFKKVVKEQTHLIPLETTTRESDIRAFRDDLSFVIKGALANPRSTGKIILGDSRNVDKYFSEKFDLVITSPPYPNRMSYIRELRPYMYWLGHLNQPREAGELDWKSIGGTWGIATSRLNNWSKDEHSYCPDYLIEVIESVKKSDTKSGEILANYIGKYFEDIWYHLNSVKRVMEPGGEVHYIIGNSKFYDVIVPSEIVFGDMMEKIGFESCSIKQIRKRNSKKELSEFDVHAIAG